MTYSRTNASTHPVPLAADSSNLNSDWKIGHLSRPGSDGKAERPFQIRSDDELMETLRQIAGADKTVFKMRTVRVSGHVDAVYWAQIHWGREFQWSTTYHKTHFDISLMGFWKRYQYRCLALYTETPTSIEELAKGIAEYAKNRRKS